MNLDLLKFKIGKKADFEQLLVFIKWIVLFSILLAAVGFLLKRLGAW